ncbi:DapH/DapD/GlmU-related protein [Bacteroides sp. K03]|uniref:DapH/DapD/GlmU-related protein n=1 Tax=Bacteroides sp. K03 TaxID=2718928 RepID=UPI0021052C86|nr:DapH/DapD/GlmU-related protein [Bacteroides sp. K03]
MGENLILDHPFSTILNAKSIGNNFRCKNNITIGNVGDDESKRPMIGNNVYVGANAVIIGSISIGDNVIVGAGAVVVKDVPSNCVIVGNPSRIIRK